MRTGRVENFSAQVAELIRHEHEYVQFENSWGGSQQLTNFHTRRRTCTWRSSCKYDTPYGRIGRSYRKIQLEPTVHVDQKGAHGNFVGGLRRGKHASTFLVVILAALEEFLTEVAQPFFYRIMTWWLLLQSWGNLRFADHRGLVRVEGGSLVAKLTRSKTLGTDKPVSSRLIIVDSETYIRKRNWVVEGWNYSRKKLPSSEITFSRLQAVITKAFNAKSFVTTRRSHCKLVSWRLYPIAVPGSSIYVPTFLDASQRQKLSADSSFGSGLKKRISWAAGPRTGGGGGGGVANDTTGWRNTRSHRSNGMSSNSFGTKMQWTPCQSRIRSASFQISSALNKSTKEKSLVPSDFSARVVFRRRSGQRATGT